MAEKLRFDRRRKAWVENPKSWLQEISEKNDDFHAGVILGISVGGVLFSVVMTLAALFNLL